jgi:catechol 2,3-dioxygenase-like lactoylglutathione lyase family enzyme
MPRLLAAYPISDEELLALPVRALDAAVRFYESVLGFTAAGREGVRVAVARDDVRLGLVERADHDPGRAGSLAVEVDDLEGLHAELQRAGGKPGEFGVDEWDGRTHQTFFLRESENGYCYCFFRPT